MKPLPGYRPHTYEAAAAVYEGRRRANLVLRDQLHRAIVQNWLLHAMLEIAGRYEEILSEDLTVPDPRYDFFLKDHPLQGEEAVRSLYRGLVDSRSTVIVSDPQRYAVADWGFCSEQVNHQYTTADVAARLGVPVSSPDECFVIHKPVAMVWGYTPQALLTGETLYFAPLAAWGYTTITPDQYLSTEGIAQNLSPVIERAHSDYMATRRALLGAR